MLHGLKATPSRVVDMLAIGLILLAAVMIVMAAAGRDYLNIGTETDFIGAFQVQAAAFLAGEPMDLEFHPPGYSISVGLAYLFLGEWMAAGLTITVFSAILVLVVSYLCFRELLGTTAGLGALAALLGSTVFFSFSIQSTSDIFFLAIWSMALYTVIVAMRKQNAWLWLVSGLFVASTILTRTNGIVLLQLVVAPLLTEGPKKKQAGNIAIILVGIAIPLIVWWVYSEKTGNHFMPTKTYANLALTYFSDTDRISGDARIPLEGQFVSTLDVLARDPARVLRIYLSDFMRLLKHIMFRITWPPLSFLCLLSSLLWLKRLRDPRSLIIVLITVVSIALINMKFFEARYYIFLLPVIGASLGIALTEIAMRFKNWRLSELLRGAIVSTLSVIVFLTVGYKGFSFAEDHALTAQFREIVSVIESVTPDDSMIVCRKCNAAFHAQRAIIWFPITEDPSQLCNFLSQTTANRPVYILIAKSEILMRPEIAKLLLDEILPPWGELIAEGDVGGPWRIILYHKEAACF